MNVFYVALQAERRRIMTETVGAGGHTVNMSVFLRQHGDVLLHVVHQPATQTAKQRELAFYSAKPNRLKVKSLTGCCC